MNPYIDLDAIARDGERERVWHGVARAARKLSARVDQWGEQATAELGQVVNRLRQVRRALERAPTPPAASTTSAAGGIPPDTWWVTQIDGYPTLAEAIRAGSAPLLGSFQAGSRCAAEQIAGTRWPGVRVVAANLQQMEQICGADDHADAAARLGL